MVELCSIRFPSCYMLPKCFTNFFYVQQLLLQVKCPLLQRGSRGFFSLLWCQISVFSTQKYWESWQEEKRPQLRLWSRFDTLRRILSIYKNNTKNIFKKAVFFFLFYIWIQSANKCPQQYSPSHHTCLVKKYTSVI